VLKANRLRCPSHKASSLPAAPQVSISASSFIAFYFQLFSIPAPRPSTFDSRPSTPQFSLTTFASPTSFHFIVAKLPISAFSFIYFSFYPLLVPRLSSFVSRLSSLVSRLSSLVSRLSTPHLRSPVSGLRPPLDPRLSTLAPRPSTFDLRPSTFDSRPSTSPSPSGLTPQVFDFPPGLRPFPSLAPRLSTSPVPHLRSQVSGLRPLPRRPRSRSSRTGLSASFQRPGIRGQRSGGNGERSFPGPAEQHPRTLNQELRTRKQEQLSRPFSRRHHRILLHRLPRGPLRGQKAPHRNARLEIRSHF
jgi:hypothetical protein